MLKPLEDHASWARRYGINIKTLRCRFCDRVFETTVPVAYGRWRGLETPDHGCGEQSIMFAGVELDENGRNQWKGFFDAMRESLDSID
jgi:hypothetical protein